LDETEKRFLRDLKAAREAEVRSRIREMTSQELQQRPTALEPPTPSTPEPEPAQNLPALPMRLTLRRRVDLTMGRQQMYELQIQELQGLMRLVVARLQDVMDELELEGDPIPVELTEI
jgi:hypothetical protein